LGSEVSDEPLCRDLCKQADVIILSVNYRHAPEARFPAAVEDAFAALQWVADNTESLGGRPGQLAVAGWSAGANLAAVVAQLARDSSSGPALQGQLLLTPVTDCDFDRPSYTDNGAGFVLTEDLMRWFWDHYMDGADRTDPRVSPLRAASLAGLAPAMVVACEFDPLRDEGLAYADALAAAGVSVKKVLAKGHVHTSVPAVDALPTGAAIRAQMAEGLRSFFA
jgi:acetyl esterase/lipase